MFDSTLLVTRSLADNFSSFLRAVIAFVVITVTWWMTFKNLAIPEEWNAVFLTVLGFYFGERPLSSASGLRASREEHKSDLSGASHRERLKANLAPMSEITWQFLLALSLIGGALAAYLYPTYDGSIDALWLAGVVLAVGFYFKETDVAYEPWVTNRIETMQAHQFFRAVIALAVALSTIPLVLAATAAAESVTDSEAITEGLPLDWAAVVMIVVVFYFKEREAVPQTDA